MTKSFIDRYKQSHQNRINQAFHAIGIPTIVVSLVVVFFNWRVGLGFFLFGWSLQFIGHLFEGKRPAFFSNPIFLLIGPLWVVKKWFGKQK